MKEESSVFDFFPVNRSDFTGPVLITGAGGCIGSWTMALLVNAGVPVVAFDLSQDLSRPRLLMGEEDLKKVTWVLGDIADTEAILNVVTEHQIEAIIHLAGLQIPFCKADPAAGAKVNVLGTINVLEAARNAQLKRITYASSIAAISFLPETTWLETLYGAYKLCNELTARVYMQDWGVPSVGIRPGVVYGVARDRGVSSKTTVAILAAAAGKPYTVPFAGPVSALHAGEAASAFIRAVSADRDEARIFDLNGRATSVAEMLDILRKFNPGSDLSITGNELPFPAALSDAPIHEYLGDYGQISLERGIRETYESFKELMARGLLSAEAID